MPGFVSVSLTSNWVAGDAWVGGTPIDITVDDDDAFEWGRKLACEEGIMAGISSGANMWAAAQVAARPEFRGKRIVTIMCSLGERYLSTPLFGGLSG